MTGLPFENIIYSIALAAKLLLIWFSAKLIDTLRAVMAYSLFSRGGYSTVKLLIGA